MDKFMYQIALKHIEDCKTISALEVLIREYTIVLQKSDLFSYMPKENRLLVETLLYYKLLSFALIKFHSKSKKSLPEFIYNTKNRIQNKVLFEIFNLPTSPSKYLTQLPTYEEFIDWFEFDTELTVPNFQGFMEVFNSIIENKPIHFRIVFATAMEAFEISSTKLPQPLYTLTYAIRYKQVNFPNKPQTVWDLLIAKLRADAQPCYKNGFDVVPEITKLEQQITALKSLKDYNDQQ